MNGSMEQGARSRARELFRRVGFSVGFAGWRMANRLAKWESLDRVRWWIEDRANQIWSRAYEGSAEELRSVYAGEIPPKHMSKRQYAELAQFSRAAIGAFCVHCVWRGTLAEACSDSCPKCGEGVHLEPFEAVKEEGR